MLEGFKIFFFLILNKHMEAMETGQNLKSHKCCKGELLLANAN